MSGKEQVVGKVDDLAPGQMKTVKIGKTKILLVRTPKGDFCALGTTCPHAGAELENGLFCEERIVCPWHKSVFNVRTGEVLEPPALDDLPRYSVGTRGSDLVLSFPRKIKSAKIKRSAGSRRPKTAKTFVILGAGATGLAAAQQLRKSGFGGRVVLISQESRPSYDRTLLSKQYLSGQAEPAWLPMRPESFFAQFGIERWQRRVESVDVTARQITFHNGYPTLAYDTLLLATGGTPIQLRVDGVQEHARTLRTPEDADAIISLAKAGSEAVVIGSSFVGMEVASSLTQRDVQTTIVTPEAVPFEKKLGRPIGEILQRLHERMGVQFRLKNKVSRITSRGTGKRELILETGERLQTNLVVVGIGVRPATDYLRGIKLNPDGGVAVDECFRVAGQPALFAAGDIAAFPVPPNGEIARIEHWRVAEEQGRIAALNMMERRTPYAGVPYFWTTHFDVRFDYVGHAEHWDEIIVRGDPDKPDFIAFYINGGRPAAAIAAGQDIQAAMFMELLRQNRVPDPDQLRSEVLDLTGFLFGSGLKPEISKTDAIAAPND
jgi:NADPH-dependent 2,4-dienoyl-CoA reductase/sulfur reductase-like enzyme/nitrite reductase/ring-hydroxylating ferredoxin subunit